MIKYYNPNSIGDIILSGGTEQRNLPEGYTQVEYLESTGTQYLISPYIVNNKTKFYCRYMQTERGGEVAQVIFGVTDNPTPNIAYKGISRLLSGTATFNRVGWGNTESGSVIDISGYDSLNTWYELYYDQNKLNINNTLVATSNTPLNSIWSANYGLGIFARNGASVTMKSKAKISSIWAKEDDVYKLNLIPCRRNSDNALGMYDTVTGNFLTNQGTGTFIAGADVTTPSPEIPMNIWCNNGVLKVNTEASGQNAINTSDIVQGYIGYTTPGNVPNIVTSAASNTIKFAIKCENGKKYRFSYVSTIAGNRSVIITNDNGIALTSISQFIVDIGLNEYTITAGATGWYWLTIQAGDLATVQPSIYELGKVYADGIVETIQAHGKNLFDVDNAEIQNNTAISADGSLVSNIAVNTCITFIPVKPNTTYTISGNILGTETAFFRLAQYKVDKTFIGRSEDSTGARSSYTFTTSINTHYIRFHYRISADLNTYQLEQGSIATAYEPYFNGGSAIAEILLKVGQYKDRESVLDGIVTRNVGIKVLDGTENIYNGAGAAGYWGIASSYFPNIKMQTSGALLTTHWKEGSYISPTGAYCSIAGTTYFAFNKASLPNVSTAEAVKQYLADQYNAGTPVIVVYPLATPTTEKVASQFLNGINVTQTAGSIQNLPIDISYLHSLKKCYVTDNSGTLQEVNKIYIGNTIIYTSI